MNKRGLIGTIIVMGVLLVVGFFWFVGEWNGEEEIECVPASCCHATECVSASEAPNCSGVFCTENCEPGTLDCGQGSCKTVDGTCEVAWDEKQKVGFANPASTYCVKQGYKLEIRNDAQGNQYGVCIFSNNLECEEWAFYRGECNLNEVN